MYEPFEYVGAQVILPYQQKDGPELKHGHLVNLLKTVEKRWITLELLELEEFIDEFVVFY